MENTNVSNENIANNAVLVYLTIKKPSFSAKDNKASSEVTGAAGVDKHAARVWKSLFPRNPLIKAMNSAERELRIFHYLNTLPYMYDGQRFLPTANYDAYMEKFSGLKRKFEKAVEDFLGSYPSMLEEAKLFLKDLYVEDDYPSVEALRSKISVRLSTSPMPVASSYFELGVNTQDAQRMCKELEEELQATFEAANRSLWERTYFSLKKFVEQLADPKKKIRPETIPSVLEMIDVLPRMNITADPRLDEMAKELKASLESLNYDEVRSDAAVATEAMLRTQKVCSAMSALMGTSFSSDPLSQEGDDDDNVLGFLNAA